MTKADVIALDVGGSSIKSGIVDLSSMAIRNMQNAPIDSSGSRTEILDCLAQQIRHHLRSITTSQPVRVGLAFPGPFDYDEGISHIHGLTKFESLYGVNLRDSLGELLHVPTTMRFRNDAEAAVVGEAIHGAGQGHARIIGVTLGTGLGSAFLVDGHPVLGGVGVPPHGWIHDLPINGFRADDVLSTRGFARILREHGVNATDAASASDLARSGDLAASAAFKVFGAQLGALLGPLTSKFAADRILILGGLSAAFDLFGEPLNHRVSGRAVQGLLSHDAAILGAAMLFTPEVTEA